LTLFNWNGGKKVPVISAAVPVLGRQKMTHKNKKKLINFISEIVRCSVLRAEGFSCGLDVFYGGLGINNCNF
jgi:hypothetical protein